MGRIGDDIQRLMGDLLGNDDEARIRVRAVQVRERYAAALKTVYRESTGSFLAHTNNVYIMNKDGVRTLIVYVDSSIYAAELNAQRELIKLKLMELFGENVEKFEIYVSRGKYKKYHPYVLGETSDVESVVEKRSLTAEEMERVDSTSSVIEDTRLRRVFKKAMTSDLTFGSKENGKQS